MRHRRPCRTAILVLSPCATRPRTPRRHPTATSPYAHRAAPALLLAVAPRHRLAVPIPWTAVTPSPRHARLQKGLNSLSRALPRAPSRHCCRHGRHTVSSTLGLRIEPIDPRISFSSTTGTPLCWSLVHGSRRHQLGPSPVSSMRQPFSQPTDTPNLLSRTP
jgi:hypothetical protein